MGEDLERSVDLAEDELPVGGPEAERAEAGAVNGVDAVFEVTALLQHLCHAARHRELVALQQAEPQSGGERHRQPWRRQGRWVARSQQ